MADVEYHHENTGTNGWVQAGAALGGLSFLGNFLRGGCGGLGGFGGWGGACTPNFGMGPGFGPGYGYGQFADFNLQQQNIHLQAENGQFRAENYSDKNSKEVYAQTLTDNRLLAEKTDRKFELVQANVNALNDYAHNQAIEVARLQEKYDCCCKQMDLMQQINAGKMNEVALTLNGKIDTAVAALDGKINTKTSELNGQIANVATASSHNFDLVNQSLACIRESEAALTARLNNITNEIIPLCKVCPQPMPRFNTFTTPTAQAPDCGACCQVSTAAAAS